VVILYTKVVNSARTVYHGGCDWLRCFITVVVTGCKLYHSCFVYIIVVLCGCTIYCILVVCVVLYFVTDSKLCALGGIRKVQMVYGIWKISWYGSI